MFQTTTITDERISDLLCGAFEGGSNYWYCIELQRKPEGAECTYVQDYPLQGGSLLISADGNPNPARGDGFWLLNREALESGLETMQEKYPRHWHDFVSEQDDAETADVYLQCCLFGEVVFG